jgi:hypothetical protein
MFGDIIGQNPFSANLQLELLPHEEASFRDWADQNNINDPFHPKQYYDLVSAWRSGLNRGAELSQGEQGHFPDTYKLPGHPTFSMESQFYQPGMKAGFWDMRQRGGEDETYTPLDSLKHIPLDTSLFLKSLTGK